MEFVAASLPMTQDGFANAASSLRVSAPEVWAVLSVEILRAVFCPIDALSFSSNATFSAGSPEANSMTAISVTRCPVRAAQICLIFRGFHPGPVDGVEGQLTTAALKDFQKSVGLPQTGAIDQATIALLRPDPVI
jgi:hypothetical protein